MLDDLFCTALFIFFSEVNWHHGPRECLRISLPPPPPGRTQKCGRKKPPPRLSLLGFFCFIPRLQGLSFQPWTLFTAAHRHCRPPPRVHDVKAGGRASSQGNTETIKTTRKLLLPKLVGTIFVSEAMSDIATMAAFEIGRTEAAPGGAAAPWCYGASELPKANQTSPSRPDRFANIGDGAPGGHMMPINR